MGRQEVSEGRVKGGEAGYALGVEGQLRKLSRGSSHIKDPRW